MNLFAKEPWKSRLPIYDIIINNLDENGCLAGNHNLPDEKEYGDDKGIKWAPGALDGAMGQQHSETDDKALFLKLDVAAKRLNVDLKEVHWKRLIKKAGEVGCWYNVMEHSNETNIDNILEFALHNLPFAEKCIGPDTSMGIGKDFLIYNSFNFVLQGLKKFPGKGKRILLYAMDSPVISNRNAYLNVFEAWGYDNVDVSLIEKLEKQVEIGPYDKMKERINKFLDNR
ncbi:hypothetical protein [Vallitalea okinawensis]|uniref:hypothetical protein n=1 Tax=Vallitalea okinawensis TaxID=2078660 RepID=UPI000CFC4F80|nr:hypothetical protein [Vallitalea okinawensis]